MVYPQNKCLSFRHSWEIKLIMVGTVFIFSIDKCAVPGIPGIGRKTAISLVKSYPDLLQSLEDIDYDTAESALRK
jgi:hypothetical protein